MTMHDRRDAELDAIRAMVARAAPERVRQLIEDIKAAEPAPAGRLN